MINTDPAYIFKGSLAGIFVNALPLAIIAGCFPILTAPIALFVLGLLLFRCHCAYLEERFSNYAILILLLHLTLAPLISAGFIALITHEKLPFAPAILLTLTPILISAAAIAIYAQVPSHQSPFHIQKTKIMVENVKPTLSKWRAIMGGVAALVGSYFIGQNYAYYIMALMICAIGIYIIAYFHPAIHGLRVLRRTERQNEVHYEFENLKAINDWRARSKTARAATAIRNIVSKNNNL